MAAAGSTSAVQQLRVLLTAVVALIMMLQQLPVPCMATNFVVGDILGWGIPRYPSFYHDWAMSTLPNGFHTGDSLDFVYASGKDSVMQVTVDDYNTCNTMHPIASWSNGPAAYPLHGFTILYFISGAPGHCAAGEKVTIEVLNAPLPL
ncbi:unnamed protein product [Sphagnum troendelagicum]